MSEYPWHVWERSLRDIYNKSPILQRFLHEHPDWYTDEVHRILTGGSPTPGARTTSQCQNVGPTYSAKRNRADWLSWRVTAQTGTEVTRATHQVVIERAIHQRGARSAVRSLLVLFTESLDVCFAVRIEAFLAALLPWALSSGDVMSQSCRHFLRTARRSCRSSCRVGRPKNQ